MDTVKSSARAGSDDCASVRPCEITPASIADHDLRRIVQAAGLAAYRIDYQTGACHLSPELLALLGTEPSESMVVAEGCPLWVHPDDRARVLKVLHQTCGAGLSGAFEQEYRVLCADGRECWVLDKGRVQGRPDDGRPAWGAGVLLEITDRRISEQQQRSELEARMRELNCLYAVSRLVQQQEDPHILFTQVVQLIPTGFAEPGRTFGRIVHGDRLYSSASFGFSSTMLCEPLVVGGQEVGRLELHRLETPDRPAAPFRKEEQDLIRALAKPLLRVIEREQVLQALRESEDLWRTMTEALAEGVVLHDGSGHVVAWNPSAERLLARSPLDLQGRACDDEVWGLVYENGVPIPAEENPVRRCLETGQPEDTLVIGLVRPDGSRIWVCANVRPLIYAGETRPYAVVVSFSDITERKNSEREHGLFAAIVEMSADAMFSCDCELRIQSWNQGAELLLGYSAEAIIGGSVLRLVPEVRHDETRALLERILRGERVPHFDTERRHRDGRLVPVSLAVSPIFDKQGQVVGAAAVAHDISERKRMEAELHRSAFYDTLTGVANRSLFMDRLGHVIARSERFGERYAVLVMDMDNFKLINDSFGHLLGDKLLCAFTTRIQELLRPVDTLARFGGDEFTLLLEETENAAAVVDIAERILVALKQPFLLDGQEIIISSSLGITLGDVAYASPDQALRDADAALYEAKRRGKNQFVLFDARMRGEEVSRLYLESELRRALLATELTVEYQPIVDLQDGSPVGCEALARWLHPTMGQVEPGRFINVAEDTGLITPLGRFVLERAVQALAGWLREARAPATFYVSVNVSPKEFYAGDLVPFVQSILKRYRLQGAHLRLEITESVVIQHDREASHILLALQAMGVQVCMDDFGTGYSSLSYLHQLPFNVIKVDRSFIQSLADKKQSREVVRSIVRLARALDMQPIAEGAETPEQLAHVKALGFRWVQGFALYKPLSSEEMRRLFVASA